MPEGYKCDDCGDFYRPLNSATMIEFTRVVGETGGKYSPTMTLCRACAQELRDELTGTEPPVEVTG